MKGHDFLHGLNELGLLLRGKHLDSRPMGAPGGLLHPGQNGAPLIRQTAALGAAILGRWGTPHEATGFQPFQRPGGGGAVQRHGAGKGGLVCLFQRIEGREKTVLHRRHRETAAQLRKQADMNLVHPPRQKAGALKKPPCLPFPTIGGNSASF